MVPWPTAPRSIFFTTDVNTDAATLSRAVSRGALRRLGRGLYSADGATSTQDLVHANRWQIVAHHAPDGVLVDRTAIDQRGPMIVVASRQRTRNVKLPGLLLRTRPGGALDDDNPWVQGLRLSSPARALVDNLAASQQRGHGRRTLSREELEDWLDGLLRTRGDAALNRLRNRAKEIAHELGVPERVTVIDELIGRSLGTVVGRVRGPQARARAAGRGYDPRRLELFHKAAKQLTEAVDGEPTLRPAEDEVASLLPFYESYFSNFIEGTEFTLEQAVAIVERGEIPPATASTPPRSSRSKACPRGSPRRSLTSGSG